MGYMFLSSKLGDEEIWQRRHETFSKYDLAVTFLGYSRVTV